MIAKKAARSDKVFERVDRKEVATRMTLLADQLAAAAMELSEMVKELKEEGE